MRTIEEVKKDVLSAVDANREKIIEIGMQVWKNPEAGFREMKTAELASGILRDLGLDVREKLALTGLRADLVMEKDGPVLAILGEMDALILPNHPEACPDTGAVHACGHNAHIAGMLGTAIALKKADVAKDLSGKIAFIAAPAEECIEVEYRSDLIDKGMIRSICGKQELIRCGAFDDVDLAYMLHLGEDYFAWDGNGFLVKKITIHGKSIHAASPAGSVNALSAMSLAQCAIGLLRESILPTDRIHGIVTKGGLSTNIVPDTVNAEYMIRSNSIENLHALNKKFDQAISCSAQALGASAEIHTLPGEMPMKNNTELFEVYKKAVSELEPDVAIPDIFPITGSTDMGDVSSIVPDLHAYAVGAKGACHSVDYRIDNPESAYITNTKIMALMAVELLYGNAAKACKIAEEKKQKFSIQEYIANLESLFSPA